MTSTTPVVNATRWKPEPLAWLALAATVLGGLFVYLKSEQLVASGARMGLYALVPLAPLGVMLVVAALRGENGPLTRYAAPLAGIGLLLAFVHALYAWMGAKGSELCGTSSTCFDGVGSPFLSLSWLDWLAIASYFAVVAAAATTARPTKPY